MSDPYATQQANGRENGEEQYEQWSLDVLAEHIVKQHHAYAKKMTPLLREYAETVARVHGEWHPETRTIAQLFEKVSGEMAMHMQREELLLFPYIRRLLRAQAENSQLTPPPFGTARELIRKMDEEHDETDEQMAQLVELSNGYTPPEDACETYNTLYSGLKAFDADTRKHILLEDTVLFPRTIQLEEELRQL